MTSEQLDDFFKTLYELDRLVSKAILFQYILSLLKRNAVMEARKRNPPPRLLPLQRLPLRRRPPQGPHLDVLLPPRLCRNVLPLTHLPVRHASENPQREQHPSVETQAGRIEAAETPSGYFEILYEPGGY